MSTVLIVDADQGFTEPTQAALEAQGVTVHVREDASIDVVRKLKPTVMMVNVELPKGASTGFSICSRIRRDRELRTLPILLTSSEASVEALKKHAQSADHADDYARKPIPIPDVVARIERLLSNAPDLFLEKTPPPGALKTEPEDPSAKNGASTESLASDFDEEARVEAPAVKDPTVPPPEPKAGPPPLRRDAGTPLPSTAAEELWRPMRLEEALKAVGDLPEPEKQGTAKANPEERLTYLRSLVKYYESRDKVFRDAWNQTQQQGQELARRAVSFALDNQAKDRRLNETLTDRDQTHRRFQAVETEFKTFQDEITRIFREKDAEEADIRGRLSVLEATNERLEGDLKSALERNRDDEHRLTIFQEEVGEFQADQERAENQITDLTNELGETKAQADELRARFEMAESVARERAEEIEKLREKLDNWAVEVNQERERVETDHADAIFAIETDYGTQIEHLKRDQEEELERLKSEHAEIAQQESERHAELLEKLTSTHENEVGSIERAHADAHGRAEKLTSEVALLEEKLHKTETAHAAEVGSLRADIESAEHSSRAMEAKVIELEASLETTGEERNDLVAQLESTAAELANTKEQLEALEVDEEASRTRTKALEEELDTAQNEAFERQTELDRLKKAHEKLQGKSQNLETSLKITEKALAAAEGKARAGDERSSGLQEENESLHRQLDALEEAHAALEAAAREQAERLDNEKRLHREASERVGELERLEDELARRDQALSEAYAQITDAPRKNEAVLRVASVICAYASESS
jgi:DNA-binding response OmpR family regulator/chromosome segregation ATPase